ncbi:MAG: glycosyltransferase [Dorea sp.]|nr:glycosyltransferase [Dorea sp.]
MISISIIMPLYNAEKYLDEALRCIQKQTYKEYELICIDDASTDTTTDILRRFQSEDNRIRIFSNKERLGAARSRNIGVREAKGEYLSFLDGDDIFEEEMLEALYNVMKRQDVDIVIFEYQHVPSGCIYEKKFIQHSDKFREKYCYNSFSVQKNEPIEYTRWSSSPCNKLFKKSFIESNHIVFQDLSSANDVYFVNIALFLAEKIIMLDDSRVMVYARDHRVPTRISYNRNPMCTYLAMEKLGKELVQRGVFVKVFQHYYCTLFFALQGALLNTKQEKRAREFYDFLRNEGLGRLINLSFEYYHKINEYIKIQLQNFYDLEFSTGWYKNGTILSGYLNMNSKKVIDLLKIYLEKDMQIVVWGAGRNGKSLLDFLSQHNIEVTCVIDKDEKKYGQVISGHLIRKPEEILDNGQLILISSRYINYKKYTEMLNRSKIVLFF